MRRRGFRGSSSIAIYVAPRGGLELRRDRVRWRPHTNTAKQGRSIKIAAKANDMLLFLRPVSGLGTYIRVLSHVTSCLQ